MEEKGNAKFLNNVTFTGSVTDKVTGLQYMNARFYNPATGRFISQDTYTGNPYDPWTQHLYTYTMNNPVNFVDPTGHFPQGTGGSGTVKPGPSYLIPGKPAGPTFDPADYNYGNDGGTAYVGAEGKTWSNVDITDQATTVLHDNANAAVERRVSGFISGMGTSVAGGPVAGFLASAGPRLYWFYTQVKQGAPWDYKDEARWNATFPNIDFMGIENKGYTFYGETISTTDLGNINFGYAGAALGIPKEVLLIGAGTFQLYDHDEYKGNLPGAFWAAITEYGPEQRYGDELDDYRYTNWGIDLYYSGM